GDSVHVMSPWSLSSTRRYEVRASLYVEGVCRYEADTGGQGHLIDPGDRGSLRCVEGLAGGGRLGPHEQARAGRQVERLRRAAEGGPAAKHGRVGRRLDGERLAA